MNKKVKITISVLFCLIMLPVIYFALGFIWFACSMCGDIELPVASFLTNDEVRVIEKYVGVEFPDSCKKISCYYNCSDRFHLYIVAEFSQSDLDVYMQGQQWDSYTGKPGDQIDDLDLPFQVDYREPVFTFKTAPVIPWWQPTYSNVLWDRGESYDDGNKSTHISESLEKDGDNWRVYIIKSRYDDYSRDIQAIFSEVLIKEWKVEGEGQS